MKKYKNYFKELFFEKILLAFIFSIVFFSSYSQTTYSVTDYSNKKNWAALPSMKDFSDSIPKQLKDKSILNGDVDVFFIHPTTYKNENFITWNADINDSVVNKLTDETTILYQASAFNVSGSVYCPRYRQAHLNAFYINQDIAAPYFDTAYQDIKNAFEFYLRYYNNGKPIIIAAHSQGTKHAGRLLKEFFENKPLYKKLVCAYLIGMPVPENYFKNIPPCNNPDQIGCFVSWRTYVTGYNPPLISKENFKCIVVNPLSWQINDSLYSDKLNKGGVMQNFNRIIPHVVDAKIHNNILWSCKPNIFGKIFIRTKNFHIGDINLFYVNIRENVINRINHYKL